MLRRLARCGCSRWRLSRRIEPLSLHCTGATYRLARRVGHCASSTKAAESSFAADEPASTYEIDCYPITGVLVEPERDTIVFSDSLGLVAYGRQGLIWRTRRLALDDLQIGHAEGNFGGRARAMSTRRSPTRTVVCSRTSRASGSGPRLRGLAPLPVCRRSRHTTFATVASRFFTWAACRGQGSASSSATTTS